MVRAGATNAKYLTQAMFYVGDTDPRDGVLSEEEVYEFFHLVIGFNEGKALSIARQLFRIGNGNNRPNTPLNLEGRKDLHG